MNSRNCPICNSHSKKVLYHQKFSKLSGTNLLDSYDVVSCNQCGFCFSDNIPEQEMFNEYYRNMSKYETTSINSNISKYEIEKMNSMASILIPFIENVQSYIVEIGFGNGVLLSILKKSGYENLLGVDPSHQCCETITKKYGIQSIVGNIDNIGLKENSVDLLILVGVLEHLCDLDSSLKKLHSLLKSNGKIYVVVPDASQYHLGEDAPFQEFSIEHINFFGVDSLKNLMNQYDFGFISHEQNILEVNYKTKTPVLHSVFTKNEISHLNESFQKDEVTGSNLKLYIDKSKQSEQKIHQIIEKIIQKREGIIIWGTGSQMLRLLESSRLKEANIIAFVDSNPKYHGQKIHNIQVLSPDRLVQYDCPILISSRAYQNEIEIQIKDQLQLKNSIIKLFSE